MCRRFGANIVFGPKVPDRTNDASCAVMAAEVVDFTA